MVGRGGRSAALLDRDTEGWVVDLISGHSAALLATARRNSICTDDAQDAYQRALEILMRNAGRLRRDTAIGWLHVVVRNEARAVRAVRISDLGHGSEAQRDGVHCSDGASPEERVLGLDEAGRAAEALRRLKEDERRAMLLRALGLSYHEIAAETGWTRTKVNRCLAEGRSALLRRVASIEAGDECRRWQPVLSAIADGEASERDMLEARPHVRNCPACRATLREYSAADRSLSLLLPVGLAVTAARGAALADRLVPLTPAADPAVVTGGAGALVAAATKLAATAAVIGASITVSAPEPAPAGAAGTPAVTRTGMPAVTKRPVPSSPGRPAEQRAPKPESTRAASGATAAGVTEADRKQAVAAREFVPPRAPEPSLPPRTPRQDEFTP